MLALCFKPKHFPRCPTAEIELIHLKFLPFLSCVRVAVARSFGRAPVKLCATSCAYHYQIRSMNRFRNVVLRKCKSLSRVAAGGRPSASSYSSLRSMSTRDAAADDDAAAEAASVRGRGAVAVLVGSSRRRYVISAEHLSHPLIAALIDDADRRQKHKADDQPVAVNCEVVLFDHLLWMLDNAVDLHDDDDAMRELAQLYAC